MSKTWGSVFSLTVLHCWIHCKMFIFFKQLIFIKSTMSLTLLKDNIHVSKFEIVSTIASYLKFDIKLIMTSHQCMTSVWYCMQAEWWDTMMYN